MKINFIRIVVAFVIVFLVGCTAEAPSDESTTSGTDTTEKSTSAILSWTAPSTRTDGSSLPMNEVAGYKIYMGTNATNLTLVADIADAYVMEHTISNLEDGTHYFAVSTYNTDNIESNLSSVVSKTI